MKFSFFQSAVIKLQDKSTNQVLLQFYQPPRNINDGLEFRDDAIRTKDQPLIYAEENVLTTSSKIVCSPVNFFNR